ncbi:hypothetical protein ABZ929_30285 [Streptomyces physcomitrii]|uniref:hypothetical protein n=1 Tax=Streptomyces physcomitrii TaxID=2724184 RepID=UPI00343160A9
MAASGLLLVLLVLLLVRNLRAGAQLRRAEHLAALDDLAAADRGVEAAVRQRPSRHSQSGYQGGYQAGYQQAAYQWAAQPPPPVYTVPGPTQGQQSPPNEQEPDGLEPDEQRPDERVPPVAERPVPSQQHQHQPSQPRDGDGRGPAPDVESPVPPLADTGGYGYPEPSPVDYPLLPPLFLPPPPAYPQPGDAQDDLLLAALWEATHTRLRLYHETALKQANRSFRNAQLAMGTGFVLLVVFTVLAVKAPTSTASIVSGALGLTSAGLAGYVSRTFIRSQEIAAGHLRAFFSQPLEFSRYLAAERLIADAELTSEQRAGILGDLVRGMVSPQVGDVQGQSGAQGFPGAQGSSGGPGGAW